jgi:hypothetical protein
LQPGRRRCYFKKAEGAGIASEVAMTLQVYSVSITARPL